MNDYFNLQDALFSHSDASPETSPLRVEDVLATMAHLKAVCQEEPFFEIHPRTIAQIDTLARKHFFVLTDGIRRWTKPKPLSRKARLRMSRKKLRKVRG